MLARKDFNNRYVSLYEYLSQNKDINTIDELIKWLQDQKNLGATCVGFRCSCEYPSDVRAYSFSMENGK